MVTFSSALLRAKEVTVSRARGGWKPPFHGFAGRKEVTKSRHTRTECAIYGGGCRVSPWNGGFQPPPRGKR
ncbi:MAG: hypothetical protein HDS38_00565 [Bacteroides sp.]|nr:hypothetical protein [Bacteroides sp.]